MTSENTARSVLHEQEQIAERGWAFSWKSAAKAVLPPRVVQWVRPKYQRLKVRPPVGMVRFGSLRRVTPVSHIAGWDRGRPLDRYYIEAFLARHARDVRGHVLEIGDDHYTRQFGGERVTRSDVLHAFEGNPAATIIADLSHADHIPSDTFDCIIFTQTLQCVYESRAAIRTLHRILRPGGILLATFPGIAAISRPDDDQWGDYWRFTGKGARRLFGEVFPATGLAVDSAGNVLAAAAFLYGLAVEELSTDELEHVDPNYELVITARAQKSEKT